MTTQNAKLEALFDKVRALSLERRRAAIEALTEITEEPYRLSDEERVVLYPALERMRRGEFADEAAIEELLSKPWR